MSGGSAARPLLTIGIGTRNRSESLERVLDRLESIPLTQPIEFLIVDDASDDETSSVLERRSADPSSRLRVIRHRTRGGFGGSLATLILNAQGKWLLLTSDDDDVLVGSLPDLLRQLERLRPGLLIPGFVDGERGDIRAKPTGTPVGPGKIWGSIGHAPGIVFDVIEARQHVGGLTDLLASNDSFATVYPQVIIGINISSEGTLIAHWAVPTAATGDDNPSGIRDPQGEQYWSMASRMRQFFAYQAYLQRRVEESSGEKQDRFRQALEWNRIKLLDFFNAWLTVEHPAEATAVQEARHPRLARRYRLAAAARLIVSGRI